MLEEIGVVASDLVGRQLEKMNTVDPEKWTTRQVAARLGMATSTVSSDLAHGQIRIGWPLRPAQWPVVEVDHDHLLGAARPRNRRRTETEEVVRAQDSSAVCGVLHLIARHAGFVNIDDPDGHGHYVVLDANSDGLLCHQCGRRFAHLGLHAWKGHGITAAEYRVEHGLARSRGLVASETRDVLTDNARRSFAAKKKFVTNRDPAAATAARLSTSAGMSPAGLAASRAQPGQGRLGTVVVCEWCKSRFCPLTSARRRRFCSKSCASRARSRRHGSARSDH